MADLEAENTCLRAHVGVDETGVRTCFLGLKNASDAAAMMVGGVDGLSRLKIMGGGTQP